MTLRMRFRCPEAALCAALVLSVTRAHAQAEPPPLPALEQPAAPSEPPEPSNLPEPSELPEPPQLPAPTAPSEASVPAPEAQPPAVFLPPTPPPPRTARLFNGPLIPAARLALLLTVLGVASLTVGALAGAGVGALFSLGARWTVQRVDLPVPLSSAGIAVIFTAPLVLSAAGAVGLYGGARALATVTVPSLLPRLFGVFTPSHWVFEAASHALLALVLLTVGAVAVGVGASVLPQPLPRQFRMPVAGLFAGSALLGGLLMVALPVWASVQVAPLVAALVPERALPVPYLSELTALAQGQLPEEP